MGLFTIRIYYKVLLRAVHFLQLKVARHISTFFFLLLNKLDENNSFENIFCVEFTARIYTKTSFQFLVCIYLKHELFHTSATSTIIDLKKNSEYETHWIYDVVYQITEFVSLSSEFRIKWLSSDNHRHAEVDRNSQTWIEKKEVAQLIYRTSWKCRMFYYTKTSIKPKDLVRSSILCQYTSGMHI